MQLVDLPPGAHASISAVGGERAFRRRLLELGLVPGTPIQMVEVAPLGDPLKLLVRGLALSLRRGDAALIQVHAPSGPKP